MTVLLFACLIVLAALCIYLGVTRQDARDDLADREEQLSDYGRKLNQVNRDNERLWAANRNWVLWSHQQDDTQRLPAWHDLVGRVPDLPRADVDGFLADIERWANQEGGDNRGDA